jgi:ketosteroid isomerase-like protein
MPEAAAGSAVETVRRYADAWACGDAATVIGLYADDIVLHYFGDSPIAGKHRGKAAALAVLGRLSQAVKRGAPEIHDVIGGEHHAAVLAKERWGEGDDAIELNRVLLYHVRDGKLAECWIYDEDQRFVDAILAERLG